jgi:REP element-mobilizing transposase RayT
VSRLVRGLKSNNAKAANKILNRTGPFWSRDYFDRWVRDYDEEQRIIRYIEDNPIKAGLTNWPFSSASASRG